MSMQRSDIIRGPGIVALNTDVFYCKGDIEAALEMKRFQVENQIHGKVDERIDDVTAKIQFTPAGEIETALLSALYPHANPVIGASIFGASDVAAYVHTKAGRKVTFHASALTKMPPLILSTNKTAFGQAEITAVRKNNTAFDTANSLFTDAAVAFSDTSFSSANVKTEKYTAVWNSITIETESGWTIEPDMSINYHTTDEIGTVDATLEGVSVMAKCRPLNLTESQILDNMKAQGTGNLRGKSLRGGLNLVITGTTKTITIYDAALVVGPLRFGNAVLRGGEIGFMAQRAESTGTFGALFAFA
jgi:hypothetical protein